MAVISVTTLYKKLGILLSGKQTYKKLIFQKVSNLTKKYEHNPDDKNGYILLNALMKIM